MSILARREIPLVITFVTGMIVIAEYFFPVKPLPDISKLASQWAVAGAAFGLGLGVINLLQVHGRRVQQRTPKQWYFSAWLIIVMSMMIATGVVGGITNETFVWIFTNMYLPAQSTVFALVTLYMTSAAYRAFRARTWSALLLLVAGCLVMLRNAPIGQVLWSGFPVIGGWIMDVPTTGSMRAFTIGIGIGIVLTGFRVLVGLQRVGEVEQ